MKVLLDTHTFLWWITDDRLLSNRARRIVSRSSNEVYFSAVSGWEIAIKARLGRLRMKGDFEALVAEQVAANNFQVLPVQLGHALRAYSLPERHNDPFDRLLIAQAAIEGLPLLSADRKLAGYEVPVIW